jgi:predicted nucleic acid-binding protein
MSGNRALLDSNIIILASKEKIDLEKLFENYDTFFVSIITYMEVLGYENITETEKLIIDNFFSNIEIIEVGKEIAKIVIDYKNKSSKKIKLPDAIILATAKFVSGDLVTRNVSDFIDIDNSISIKEI